MLGMLKESMTHSLSLIQYTPREKEKRSGDQVPSSQDGRPELG